LATGGLVTGGLVTGGLVTGGDRQPWPVDRGLTTANWTTWEIDVPATLRRLRASAFAVGRPSCRAPVE